MSDPVTANFFKQPHRLWLILHQRYSLNLSIGSSIKAENAISPSLAPHCHSKTIVCGRTCRRRRQTSGTSPTLVPISPSSSSLAPTTPSPSPTSPASYPPSSNLRLCYLHQKARQPEHIKAFIFSLSSLPRPGVALPCGWNISTGLLTPVLRNCRLHGADSVQRRLAGSLLCEQCKFCPP